MWQEPVLAVIQHWKRLANLPPVIAALRAQSVPLHLALVDCALEPDQSAAAFAARVDTYIAIRRKNLTACSRFIPPLMLPEYRYCFFAVDDHVPGSRHVECLLRWAERNKGRFASLGQDGRRIRNGKIVKRRARPGNRPLPLDFITSSELIETRYIDKAIEFRNWLQVYEGDSRYSSEDDLILCLSLQSHRKAPCYAVPAAQPEEFWSANRLPAPHALSARPDHDERRNKFIETVQRLGWKSFVPQEQAVDA